MTPGSFVDRVRAIRARLQDDCDIAATEAVERVRQRAAEKEAALLTRVHETERPAALAMLAATEPKAP